MAVRFSTGLKNSLLDTSDLKTLLDDGTIRVYSGTVPDDADAALGGATLLCEYTDAGAVLAGGTGLDFDTAAASGALAKAPAQSWEGEAVASGSATFFRFVQQADDGTLSTTQVRIQGTVGGIGADLFVASTTFVNSTTYYIDYFAISVPDL